MMFFSALFYAWVSAAIVMAIAWVAYCITKKAFVVDIAWSLVIMIAGFVLALSHPVTVYSSYVLLLLAFWGLRLAIFLFATRILTGIEDTRYDAISSQWSGSKIWGFFLHYQLQAVLAVLIALPFYWVPLISDFNVIRVIILAIIVALILSEWVSDRQLYRFQQSHNKGVCQVGFWTWCRHPNCFFEGNIWVFFCLSCLSTSALSSVFSVISPILIHWIMVKITIPITEKKSLKSRGDAYQAYIDSTPRFCPWKKPTA